MAMILAVILFSMMVSWYAAKRHYEYRKHYYRNNVFAIAAGTTVIILTGQIIWAKAKKFLTHLSWKKQQKPKYGTGLSAKERAAAIWY